MHKMKVTVWGYEMAWQVWTIYKFEGNKHAFIPINKANCELSILYYEVRW